MCAGSLLKTDAILQGQRRPQDAAAAGAKGVDTGLVVFLLSYDSGTRTHMGTAGNMIKHTHNPERRAIGAGSWS